MSEEKKTPSIAESSSITVHNSEEHPHRPAPGHGESAIPADPKEEQEENVLDDWEDDPDNARNWPASKKWTSIAVVSG